MGVILWYQLAFPTLGLTVSSDVSSGTILSNAKITVSYALGQLGTFTVDLTALPTPAHRQLAGALSGKRGNPRRRPTGRDHARVPGVSGFAQGGPAGPGGRAGGPPRPSAARRAAHRLRGGRVPAAEH